MRPRDLMLPILLLAGGGAPLLAQAAADTSARGASAFWHALGDSTLDRLVGRVLENNLDLQAAAARIRNARAARQGVAAELAPSVSAVAGFSRLRVASASFPNASGRFPDQSLWDLGFDAGWEVDLFGRIRHTVGGLGALAEATGHDRRDLAVSLVAELARTYFDLRGAQARLAVAQRNAENQRRTLALVRDRLASGVGSAFDTERAAAQLATTLASVPALEADIAAATFRIGVLTGRSPASVSQELATDCDFPALPRDVALDNRSELVRRRPDVVAAERRAAGARSLVEASRAALKPRIGLGATVGLAAGGVGDIGDRGTLRYSVGPTISLPALNRGRLKAAVEASRAVADENRVQYDQTVLRAEEELETSLARYRTSRERLDRMSEAASASGRAAELARTRFAEGLADFLQVLDAERTQLDLENQMEAVRAAAAVAYAALYKAIGGDLAQR